MAAAELAERRALLRAHGLSFGQILSVHRTLERWAEIDARASPPQSPGDGGVGSSGAGPSGYGGGAGGGVSDENAPLGSFVLSIDASLTADEVSESTPEGGAS